MKSFSAMLAMAFFLTASAQADDRTPPLDAKKQTQTSTVHRGQGALNTVDAVTGKVNVTHEPIESLGWDRMTMDLTVQNPALLTNLKSGDRVQFELQKSGGAYQITAITPVEEPAQESSKAKDDPAHSRAQ